MQSFRWAVFATFVLTLAAAGCTSSEEGTLPPLEPIETTTTPPTTVEPSTIAPSTTSTVESATSTVASERTRISIPTSWPSNQDEIFGRYLLYWDVLQAAYGAPAADPNHPLIDEIAIPEMAADMRADLQGYLDHDEILVWSDASADEHNLGLPNVDPLDKVEGRKVLVQDCWLQDYEIVSTVDDEVVDLVQDFSLFNVTMEVVDGEWRVRSSIIQEPGAIGYDACEALSTDRS